MRLNHDCVRKLLLYLENELDAIGSFDASDFVLENFSKEDTVYTIKKLSEAGYISAKFSIDVMDDLEIYISEITWEGHKFLDTIRDNKVWAETKKALSKFSSASISFVSTIAAQILSNLISQQLGTSAHP